MVDIINPFEGLPLLATWAQLKAAGTGEGEDFKTARNYTAVAAASGLANYNGGIYHEIIIHLPDGRGIRYSEGATPIGLFPRNVTIGEPIVENCNFRDGEYRAPHMNGIDIHGNRIQFTAMVNTTIAAEQAKLHPVLQANQRISAVTVNGRNQSNTNGAILNKWDAGKIGTFDKWVNGQIVTIGSNTSDIWVRGTDDKLWYALAGATNVSTTGIDPFIITPPVIIPPVETPPVIIDPPIVTTPPVVTPPVVITPPVVTPPIESVPPVMTNPITVPVEEVGVIVSNVTARRIIYAIFIIIGLVLASIYVYFNAIVYVPPKYFTGILAVYSFISPYILGLAVANTVTKKAVSTK